MRNRSRAYALPILVAVVALVAETAARADIIFFKDGFTLEGKTSREGTSVFEGGQPIWMPRGGFFVDDLARRIYFSPAQIQEPTAQEYLPGKTLRYKGSVIYPPGVHYLGSISEVSDMGPWDDKWQRKVTLTPASGNLKTVTQQLTYLDPRIYGTATRSNSNDKWIAAYLLTELGPQPILDLLRSHPDLKDDGKLPAKERVARRISIYTFLVQAHLYELAAKELDSLAQDFPEEKKTIEDERSKLKQFQAQETFDSVKRAQAAGQHEKAYKLLAAFSEEGLEERLLTQMRDLRGKYETGRENAKLVRQLLADLPEQVELPERRKFFAEAARAITADLDVEEFLPPARDADKGKVNRLELFLTLAKKYTELKKADKTPAQKPDELVALAISGWLLGNTAAQTNVESARKLWNARDLVRSYLKSADASERQRLLADYLKGGSQVTSVEDFVQIVGQLPPNDPETQLTTQTEERDTEAGTRRKGVSYLLKLPPEYRHNRPTGYPVLIVLHNSGSKPKEILEPWAAEAAKNGYLLVAPKQINPREYEYTADEHKVVLDVLRDLKKHYAVDSDRVFLFGLGQGGNMAFDVGLSHPDLFAGVMPMSGRPRFFVNRYVGNAQFLPFYVIGGDFAGETVQDIREQLFDNWLTRGYPALYASYRGRGLEWFPGELPILMDWMNRKVRANPVQGLGRAAGYTSEFSTMRPTDNHFYWLSTDSISKRNLNIDAKWKPGVFAATMQAIVSEKNHINVNTNGINQVTVWFGRGGFIDFDKPVAIFINLKAYNVRIKPSLETLMEDLHERGDRQQPFIAKQEFKPD